MISIAHASASAAEQHGSSGLPQFETSTFGSQMFWAIASFVVLLYLLNRYVLPAISDILDARGKSIEDDLSNAERMRKEAEDTLTEYRTKLADAAREAAVTVEQARQDAARQRDLAVKELEVELAKKKASALDEIEQAKRKAMDDVKSAAVDIAMAATEKLITKSVTKMDANKMVTDAIARMEEDGKKHLH